MAPRPHLQAAAIAAWWIHGPHDHGDGWQSQLCPYHRKWPKEQVTTPQERRPTGICHDAPTVQHLHLRPANHHLHKVCICWRPSNHACWWRLAGGGRGAEQGTRVLHGRVAGTCICGVGAGTHTTMCAGSNWTCCGVGAGCTWCGRGLRNSLCGLTECWVKAHELNQLKNRKPRGCTKVVYQHCA